MSIPEQIKALENAKRLFRFVPKGRQKARRRLYLTATANKDFHDLSSAVNLLVGQGYIEAALARWTLGNHIFATDNMRKGGFLKELDPPPPDVWELRVTEPVSQARLIGAFAGQDTLILTKFHTRQKLGDKGSREWTQAMEQCRNEWSSLFPTDTPIHEADLQKYVSDNCDYFPLNR